MAFVESNIMLLFCHLSPLKGQNIPTRATMSSALKIFEFLVVDFTKPVTKC